MSRCGGRCGEGALALGRGHIAYNVSRDRYIGFINSIEEFRNLTVKHFCLNILQI